MSKECTKCNENLSLDNFQKDFGCADGYRNCCKKCKKIGNKKSASNNFVYTEDTILKCYICQKNKDYNEMCKKGTCKPIYCKECYNETRRNKSSLNTVVPETKTLEQFKLERRERNRKYYNNRIKNDATFHIMQCLRKRVYQAVKNKYGKNTIELTGCSKDDLIKHLESQFTEGMTFENYGKWHIDHIRPCTSFNLNDPEEQKKCFHWTNLQPLWAADNIRKSNKYTTDLEDSLNKLTI
jgi:hypothetical protein